MAPASIFFAELQLTPRMNSSSIKECAMLTFELSNSVVVRSGHGEAITNAHSRHQQPNEVPSRPNPEAVRSMTAQY